MKKEEAAAMIKNDMRLHHDYLSGTYRSALNMAIDALEQPQADPRRIEIQTSAGTLAAELIGTEDSPGIGLFFIPKGQSSEIDLALVEVKESADYRSNNETNEDVAMYIYGNPASDDWTERIDYRKKDVEKALSDDFI